MLGDMNSFPDGYRALVLGASGAIGGAIVRQLQADTRCALVLGLHRHTQPPVDFDQEHTIAAAAAALAAQGPFDLVVNAAGVLHSARWMPEKKLDSVNYAQMEEVFRINTLGPALVMRHFCALLAPKRGVMVMLSAKVGSIGDNRLGGWYSYRASKAALNMLVRTAAIELARTRSHAVLVALHPGTVTSDLSRPFGGGGIGRQPDVAAGEMLAVIDRLTPADTGQFVAWSGERLPW